MGFLNWVGSFFGFIGKMVKAVKAFLNSPFGQFLQETAKYIKDSTDLAKEQFPYPDGISDDEKKKIGAQRAEWVFDKVYAYCEAKDIPYHDGWIKLAIEMIYHLAKAGLLFWLR